MTRGALSQGIHGQRVSSGMCARCSDIAVRKGAVRGCEANAPFQNALN